MSSQSEYHANYDALMQLPLVQSLIAKNKKLRKKNRALKNLIYSLPEFRRPSTYSDSESREVPPPVHIKVEKGANREHIDLTQSDDDTDCRDNIVYRIEEVKRSPFPTVGADESDNETIMSCPNNTPKSTYSDQYRTVYSEDGETLLSVDKKTMLQSGVGGLTNCQNAPTDVADE